MAQSSSLHESFSSAEDNDIFGVSVIYLPTSNSDAGG
jgi:hypothetical protein